MTADAFSTLLLYAGYCAVRLLLIVAAEMAIAWLAVTWLADHLRVVM